MPWFPVDDSFHSHPKVRATSPAALGLWVLAGSWSMCYLTDGRIKDKDLPLLLPDSATLADELVANGLWRRTRGGYVFKDWLEWGNKRTAAEIREMRAKKAAAGRLGGLASGNTRRSKRSKPRSKPEAGASVVLEPPALPSPAIPTKSTTAEVVNSNVEDLPPPARNGQFDYFGTQPHGLPPERLSAEDEKRRQLDALSKFMREHPEAVTP